MSSKTKVAFSISIYLYAYNIVAESYAHPPEDSKSIDYFASTKCPKPMDSDAVINWKAIPVPAHVLAQYGIFDNPLINEIDLVHHESTSSSLKKHAVAVVCGTTVDSPLERDVQFLIDYLSEERWNWYCKQKDSEMPYCTQLVTHRTASIGICGPYRHQTMCQNAASDIASISTMCTRHINGNNRVGGISITAGVPGLLFRGLVAYHSDKLGQRNILLLEDL